MLAHLRRKAAALKAPAADPRGGLLDSDRAVLRYAAEVGVRRGTDRVALPWRAVAELVRGWASAPCRAPWRVMSGSSCSYWSSAGGRAGRAGSARSRPAATGAATTRPSEPRAA